MLIDARELETATEIVADVCIVGGGPAGLTLASELRGSGRKIVVLERGGLPGRPRGVMVSETATAVDSHFETPPEIPHRVGGGANEWVVRLPWLRLGVRMVPLSPIDLEPRPWVPHSGWPMSWTELAPYIDRAHRRLGLGPCGYAPDDWEDRRHPRLDIEPYGFTTAMERFPRARLFTSDLLEELLAASDVDIVIHAPAGSVDGQVDLVERIDIDSGSPGRVSATASVFVLAGGGMENPRLLLSARDGQGIGAGGDAVGSYFTDHLRLYTGTLTPSNARLFDRTGLYDMRTTSRGTVGGKIVPTADLQQKERLLNSAAMLIPKPDLQTSDSVREVAHVVRELRSRRRPGSWPAAADVARAMRYVTRLAPEMAVRQRRFPPRTDAGWSGVSGAARRYASFLVEHQIELAPDPANRLQLSDRRDRDGRRTTELRWQWNDLDLASIRSTQRLFGEAVEQAGLGTFESVSWEGVPEIATTGGAFHPTGTTRMSTSERSGVVNADGRVHGVHNLYVAGSSVFPTGGYANPTLTLLALTIRLADHLARNR